MPHSEISGSMFASNSPEHIVGNHVLRRLCVPRYPPLALYSLTTLVFITVLHFHEIIHVCFNCLLFSRYLCSFQGSGWSLLQQSELSLIQVLSLSMIHYRSITEMRNAKPAVLLLQFNYLKSRNNFIFYIFTELATGG